MWVYGLKIAGLKVKVPMLILDRSSNIEKEYEPSDLKKCMIVLGFFTVGSYFLKRIDIALDKKRISKWKNNNLLHLIEK